MVAGPTPPGGREPPEGPHAVMSEARDESGGPNSSFTIHAQMCRDGKAPGFGPAAPALRPVAAVRPAEPRFAPKAVAHCYRFSGFAAAGVGTVAFATLVTRWPPVATLLASLQPLSGTKSNSAIGLLLAALSLALLRRPEGGETQPRRLWAARALALAIGGIGLVTVAEYLSDSDLGVDQLLVRDRITTAGNLYPGRMSLITAIVFLLVALALLTVDFRIPGANRASQSLALLVPILPSLALLGHLYDIPVLFSLFEGSRIAQPTAISLCALGLGICTLRPTQGWMQGLNADGLAGHMARILLPLTLFAPVLVGWLRLEGQRRGFYGTEFGIALQVLTTALFLGIVAVVLGSILGREERQRISAEAILTDREEQLRLAIDGASLGVWSWNIGSGALEESARGRAMLGLAGDDELTHSTFLAALHSEDREPYERAISRSLAERTALESDLRISWPNGSQHWIALKGLGDYGPSGEALRMRGVMLDIDDRKRGERERDSLLAALETRTRELEQVIYVTSHDLRSPLVNIQGFSQELATAIAKLSALLARPESSLPVDESVRSILQDDIPESLAFIQGSATRMDGLLRGLLALSRAARAHPRMLPVDIDRLVEEVVAGLRYEIDRRGTVVNLAALPPCLGDVDQLGRVFANLFENALKFLDPARAGQIAISAERADGVVVYSVADNGVGIAEGYQDKIFEIFHRLDPSGTVGEGLGLSIVEKIVQLHGGRVWVSSEPGIGSTFHVELQATDSPEVPS